jgi:hypothetical protein
VIFCEGCLCNQPHTFTANRSKFSANKYIMADSGGAAAGGEEGVQDLTQMVQQLLGQMVSAFETSCALLNGATFILKVSFLLVAASDQVVELRQAKSNLKEGSHQHHPLMRLYSAMRLLRLCLRPINLWRGRRS